MTDEMQEIWDNLPVGHENAMTKKQLCDMYGYDRRVLRRVFESLCYLDKIACNFMDGKGYFKASNYEELEKFKKINHSYKTAYERKDHHIRRALMQFDTSPMDLSECEQKTA